MIRFYTRDTLEQYVHDKRLRMEHGHENATLAVGMDVDEPTPSKPFGSVPNEQEEDEIEESDAGSELDPRALPNLDDVGADEMQDVLDGGDSDGTVSISDTSSDESSALQLPF